MREIITPHIFFRSDKMVERNWTLVHQALRRYINGEPMIPVVDLERGHQASMAAGEPVARRHSAARCCGSGCLSPASAWRPR
jgi:hypothetical protein